MKKTLGVAFIAINLMLWQVSCSDGTNQTMNFKERQLTTDLSGHTVHQIQCFSPDNQWIVYYTRNDDGKIGATSTIAMVHVETGEIKKLYDAPNQTEFGPGVGAVTFSPQEHQVLFIHGVRNADESNPYTMTRRTGVMIKVDAPQNPIFLDARDIKAPYTKGALRGGTHAHSWSHDGKWISYTYNDYVLEQLAKKSDQVKDLRMVGIMTPQQRVDVPEFGLENNSGEWFSAIVTKVTETPKWGSDEIEKACEESWIGNKGYRKADGAEQRRALAFLGDVRSKDGSKVTEVFVADLPEVLIEEEGFPLEGSATTRPNVPAGVVQRRITYTTDEKYPGVQGPRHWTRSSPDGTKIFFMRKDENGFVQLYSVSPNGGEIFQETKNDFSIETNLAVHPNGQYIAYGNDQNIYLTDLVAHTTRKISQPLNSKGDGLSALNWSYDGKKLAFNRRIEQEGSSYYQICILE
jgi:Tol biopolymer transport system component